jgi:hypothetical protein
MITPIETYYKGNRFRSRLEARWAVFFEEIEFKWEYEKEGYSLNNQMGYLPDFWIEDLKTFIEIKPNTPKGIELEKILRFAREKSLLLIEGYPWQDHVMKNGELIEDSKYKIYPLVHNIGEGCEQWDQFIYDLEKKQNKLWKLIYPGKNCTHWYEWANSWDEMDSHSITYIMQGERNIILPIICLGKGKWFNKFLCIEQGKLIYYDQSKLDNAFLEANSIRFEQL